MFLSFWLIILFMDAIFSYRNVSQANPNVTASASPSSQTLQLSPHAVSSVTSIDSVSSMVSWAIHQNFGNSEVFQDLDVLEYLYTKNKNPDLLQPLAERFLQYYQFDKANTYLSLLLQGQNDYLALTLDPRKVIYMRLHDSTIGLDDIHALDAVFSLVQSYRSHDMLADDDMLFYKWLKALRTYDYDWATSLFSKITDPLYKDFRVSYEASLANFVKIKNPPAYYRDALISLTLLKNWYFSVAKRLALHALQSDQDYVLPYQVLAYANFLTHNREAAKDYFLKLSDFDVSNAFLYKFLIGVSYYRYGDYEQSILYLNQVADPVLLTDVYRYKLLWYIKLDDTDNMIRLWQNILGQQALQPSDFALFFDHMFYMPFRIAKPFALYRQNPQLADLCLQKCFTIFTGSQADVCTYGEVWLQLANQNLSWMGQKLLSLSENYHQSHLYHLLGDYYLSLKQYPMAREYYLKALSISDTSDEQSLLQNKIDNLP